MTLSRKVPTLKYSVVRFRRLTASCIKSGDSNTYTSLTTFDDIEPPVDRLSADSISLVVARRAAASLMSTEALRT